MKAVFNTSPLVFLCRLGFLGNALELFSEVIIPEAVIQELEVKNDAIHSHITELLTSKNIQRAAPKLQNLYSALHERLGAGESEAIAIALETESGFVILDDGAARKEASRLGLTVKGTLAIIKKLSSIGRIKITSMDEFYKNLLAINFRVRKDIFEEIMK